MLTFSLLSVGFAGASETLPRHGLLGAAVVQKANAVVVSEPVAGSAAEAAGIRAGDVVVSVDGTAPQSAREFVALVRRAAGKTVHLVLRRDGALLEKNIALRAAPLEQDPLVTTDYGTALVDGTLRRTLVTFPKETSAPLPALLIVGGIGCYSIDTTDPQDPYRRVAHDLSARGFVVMRLEKSGVGDSRGPPCRDADFAAESRSYQAAFDALTRDPHVDRARIYLFGHSIGSLVVPRLANANRTAGVIVAQGVASNWFEYELLNAERQLALGGAAPAAVEAGVAEKEYCMHRLLIEKEPLGSVLAQRPSCVDHLQYPVNETYMQQAAALKVAEPWSNVAVPVLVIYGRADFVTTEADHVRIAEIVNAGHPGFATLRTIENMNHQLSVAGSQKVFMDQFQHGKPMVYNQAFSDVLLAWLCAKEHCLEHAGRPSAAR